jgi:hypothetical protein
METVAELEKAAQDVDRYQVRGLLSNLIAHDVLWANGHIIVTEETQSEPEATWN